MPIKRTVHWTLLADPDTSLEAVAAAVSKAKFTLETQTPGQLKIDVPPHCA
ncbi:hypothetical protein [Paenarthrobacter sp. C1]|uniref:hypothetical protein n=1 Tax=Paenarthrobacter sp. C1 TaxID=3400220 RepID=UPI003BF5DF23